MGADLSAAAGPDWSRVVADILSGGDVSDRPSMQVGRPLQISSDRTLREIGGNLNDAGGPGASGQNSLTDAVAWGRDAGGISALTSTLTSGTGVVSAQTASPPLLTASTSASGSASPETIANYLTTGFWRESGQVPHSFDTSASNVITISLVGLSANDKVLARGALEAWGMVANLTFREVTGKADITFDDAKPNAFANAYYTTDGNITNADVNIGAQWVKDHGTTIGSYSFQTYIHEIGHALGLGHSGGYDSSNGTEYANDSWQISIMSYNSQAENQVVDASFAYLTSTMMADIIAIQKLYGADKGGVTAGTSIYGVGSNLGNYLDDFFDDPKAGMAHNALTIFDESGIDRIDFGDDTAKQVVNLNGGSYSNVYGLIGNLGIAKGTVIENYVGGSNADKITGNGVANNIKSNAGNDTVSAGSGNDVVNLGDGNDNGSGSVGNDFISGGNGNDILTGGSEHDTLNGDAGIDTLNGDAGNDTLNGGSQNDTLDGGAGNDMLSAGDGNDVLRGSDAIDKLYGGSGNDFLDGGIGNDTLSGGSGSDAFIFAAGKDYVEAFENNLDELRLNDSLWGGTARSIDQVLAMARVVNGDLLFDFGNGNQLTINNLTNADVLRDDLMIY